MQTHKFSLSFKENRNYIQGPDIFNEMLRHFTDKELTEIDFSIHRLSLNHQGHIFFTRDLDEFKSQAHLGHATASLSANTQKYWISFFFEKEPSQNVVYQPYDESILITQCSISEQNIFLKEESPYSFAETIVSMHKKLLQTIFPNKGKWLFTKLKLINYSTNNPNIMISFKRNFNFKLVQSDILINNQLAGEIYFSLKQEEQI